MFTQCPQCDAIFQLSASQLKAANGEVRCGQCLTIFNALENLSEEIPEAQSTNELADDAHQYRDWNVKTADGATPENTSPPEPGNIGPDETENDDVFSTVIAEANTHEIPAEEIDRFEEFLATDVLPDEDVLTTSAEDTATTPLDGSSEIPGGDALTAETLLSADEPADKTTSTENRQTVDDALPTENLSPTEIPPPSKDNLLTEDSFAATKSAATKKAANNDEDSNHITTLNTEFTNSFSTPGTDIPADETNFGDIDAVTSALDAKISTSDDEFAELDAYLHGAEEEYAQDMAEYIEETNPADNDKIIIDAADLEPISSPDYADTLDSLTEQRADKKPADNAEPKAETPADPETPPPSTDEIQTTHIPNLILDDLHAAKAEQLRPSSTPWVIGSLALMLMLVLQVAYFSRDELAKDASLRPWLIKMCNIADCTLSQPYDIKQIEIIGRDVRSHPTARKALVVSTTLINNADFVQPYPLLTVLFSDINGTRLAQRRFTPREYLHNNIDLAAGMTPDMPVRIELELVDPGKAAINYEFHAEADPRRTRPLS